MLMHRPENTERLYTGISRSVIINGKVSDGARQSTLDESSKKFCQAVPYEET
eukprot:TRINITY_DN1302_c0_g1_i1.p3 TRINITY_DN1302_c0_g1~~TRINITY_DN1302_c0_g1_i1.p3  ORF type:complete len:52 (+),score=5.42 TRINITY_DN1302_c0_g1_i1:348-503(+)